MNPQSASLGLLSRGHFRITESVHKAPRSLFRRKNLHHEIFLYFSCFIKKRNFHKTSQRKKDAFHLFLYVVHFFRRLRGLFKLCKGKKSQWQIIAFGRRLKMISKKGLKRLQCNYFNFITKIPYLIFCTTRNKDLDLTIWH